MQEYPLGTKEYLTVDVTDRLGLVTSLEGYTINYEILFRETQVIAQEGSSSVEGATMTVLSMLDTTTTGYEAYVWVVGPYQLYITISASPEAPKLGPFEFKLI